MAQSFRSASIISALLAALLLAACGGGGDGASSSAATLEQNAPQATGNTATDGFNWFNFRRQQIGEQALARNNALDGAAQGHSDYQKINNTITHEQTPGNPGFTGARVADRLAGAGYQFTQGSYAYGEVISSSGNTSGAYAADSLIAAIYHRFVIFEPMFKEVGAGAATVAGGATYFTTDFTANGLETGLGAGQSIVYPFANQTNVPINFFSDNEEPDPVPTQNEVGYPISIHADTISTVVAQTFTMQPRGGAPLQVQLMQRASDSHTPSSAAAIIPLNVLASNTIYDVQFIGTVDGIAVNRTWSFTTR